MLVGYHRCSTDQQDLTAQRDALTALGVKPNRIYGDHGAHRSSETGGPVSLVPNNFVAPALHETSIAQRQDEHTADQQQLWREAEEKRLEDEAGDWGAARH